MGTHPWVPGRWAFFSSLLGETQRLLELFAIKPHHRLAVDDGHRSCPESQLHKLLEGGLIRPDVLDDERNAVLRKELFLPVTRASPRLGIYHHLLWHHRLPFLSSTRCPCLVFSR